ncbi:FAD-binding oxidoreductase [Yinghuangia soli]|uniref:FAD-binding oxidoreductase n=1 Tax=Yinghuangia soli TaxID=2908204 RepID=A0AA41PUJ9_9ACTN|nr:FAD-binding oxidoreductase [Yinghuangia soli]MCF2526133.1 FAD-binding oxidoreductase [Yinghuangia soli]
MNAWPTRMAGGAKMPPDWRVLRRLLGARLVLPGDPDYPVERLGFNELYDDQKPAAIARSASAYEVQACLAVVRAHGLLIAARSGGHSYLGYSVPDAGLVIDLREMAGVEVLPDGTARVGAGARLIEVYAGLARAGRILPGGTCPTVGIGGLTLGGGIGVLARAYGLTCDRMAAARVVTADSRAVSATPDCEPDLYWALRGGGGGNTAVVTEFEFRTAAASDLTVFSLAFPAGSAVSVLGAWQEWFPAAPRELWASCQISGGSTPGCRVVGCWAGEPGGAGPLLDRLIAAAGAKPTSTVQVLGALDAMKWMGGCARDTIAQCHPTWEGGRLPRDSFVAVSRVLGPDPLDAAAVVELMRDRSGVDLLLDSLGGAVADLAPDATAYPHRSSLASAQIFASTSASGAPQAKASVDAVRDGLAALGARGAYVNYIDDSLPDWGHAYYGANLPRLKCVAQKYDPDGVFDFPQSVSRA